MSLLIRPKDLDVSVKLPRRMCAPTTVTYSCPALVGVVCGVLAASGLAGIAVSTCPELSRTTLADSSLQDLCNGVGLSIVCGALVIGLLASWYAACRNRDAGKIRCGHCSYELRGLTKPRCPECGTGFDRRWLTTTGFPSNTDDHGYSLSEYERFKPDENGERLPQRLTERISATPLFSSSNRRDAF